MKIVWSIILVTSIFPFSARSELRCEDLFSEVLQPESLASGMYYFEDIVIDSDAAKFAKRVLDRWESTHLLQKKAFLKFVEEFYEAAVMAKNSTEYDDYLDDQIFSFKRTADVILTYELGQQFRSIMFNASEGLQVYRLIFLLNQKAVGVKQPVEFDHIVQIAKQIKTALNDVSSVANRMKIYRDSKNGNDPSQKPYKDAATQLLRYISRRGHIPDDTTIFLAGSVPSGRGVREQSDLDFYTAQKSTDRLFENLDSWVDPDIFGRNLMVSGITEIVSQINDSSFSSIVLEITRSSIRARLRIPIGTDGEFNFDNFVYFTID